MQKKVKRGVGQPRKYKKTPCPHCGSYWHTGNGKGREKCNECKRTWAIAIDETPKILETPIPAQSEKEAIATIPATDQELAA